MALEKDLNVPPYFDDYDEDKRFHKVLFRPTTAVQARELTQAQTILQNQIERFANHMYKDGTIIDGVGITYYPKVHYISLEDQFYHANGSAAIIFPSDLDSSYVITNSTDSNTAVRAAIKIAKDGLKTSYPNTNRFYLDYNVTGTDALDEDVNEFAEGDTLYIYSNNQNTFANLDSNNLLYTVQTLVSNGVFTSNGYSYCLGVSDGIIFQKGFFTKVEPQVIAIRDFSTNVSNYVVGFNTEEVIVNENEDSSLNDNALGYPNENAPGAHRLKLIPTLVSKERTDSANNKTFFAIVEFDEKDPVEQKDTSEYNDIGDKIALRTYEESGDYVVKPFLIESRVNYANSDNFYYEISPGIAFVRGFRIEKVGSSRVVASRATQTEVAQNQVVTANYGNYVVCDEFLGEFDTEQIKEISLYDQPQNAISEYEGTSSAPSGSVVGKANIRAVVFEDGTKGLPTAKYLVYLFNIRMNTGKSFSTDVKSLYVSGSFGAAKADIVLENGLAVLKETTNKTTVFNTGLQAIKRLTNNTGIGDTNYSYIQTKSGTISSAGEVTITLDTAAPGASTERLNYSVGALSSSARENFNVYLSTNAYSSNLTGNIAISSGNVVIVGTGTTFTTSLTANSNIRIYSNTSQAYVRRVVSIANNTQLTIDASIPDSNTSTKFGKYFVTGTPLPLDNVTINSNTSFTANVNITLDSGTQTVYCSYPVNRNQATAIPKVINKNKFVKIDCSNNVANSVGPWNLGLSDVLKVRNVYVGTTYSTNTTNRVSWFDLDSGQRDDMYDHAKLVVKPQYKSEITGSTKLLVELDHFTTNTSASVGFFSVESYPIDDANTANTNAIQTIDLPLFNGRELRNYIDFRPYKSNTAVSSSTIAGASINPATSANVFSVPATGQYTIVPDTNFEADYEYYLPRKDIITIDTAGDFIVNEGIPSRKPVTPFVENDQTLVAETFVPPYPSTTTREYETNKNTPSIKILSKTNRRYTMKDIGLLDERIKRIEYYTVLNVLEQQARDLTIPDASGLDRFKNGIFADPFNSHRLGNISDFEYKIAVDINETVARPFFQTHDIDFQFVPNTSSDSVKSSNVRVIGPLVMLDHTDQAYIRQRFSTKYRIATEASWQWNGLLELYPNYDFFRDETLLPSTTITIDLASAWEDFANSPFGMIYGNWQTIATQTSSSTTFANSVVEGTNSVTNISTATTATTTNVTQQQTIQSLNVNTLTQTIDLGTYVKEISINPYMRSRLVAFVSNSMKPRTTLHGFFDNINVDEHCAPGVLSGITNPQEGLEDRVVSQNGDFGSPLVSDANGFVCGLFRIPEGKFRTGDRVFMLTNVRDLVTGIDARTSIAKATYTADNVSVSKSSSTINVIQPELATLSTTQQRLISSTVFTSNTVSNTVVTEPVDGQVPVDSTTGDGGGSGAGGGDPIAQSFTIENIPAAVTGVFLTKIGLYFRSKDFTLGCSVFVCEMENNMPDQSRIIGRAHLASSQINVSRGPTLGESLVETIFELDFPVYLLANRDYAFFIQPDGNSPNYGVWISETGNFDVTTNEQVFSNPYSGIMFISANRKTWTAIQKEDITFNLYRARFTQTTGNAIFKNETDEYISVDGFTKANTTASLAVGDLVLTVDSAANIGNVTSIVSNTLTNAVSGRIQWVNEAEGELWIDSSTANSSSYFSNTTNPTIAIYRVAQQGNASLINANTLIAYANITSVDNLKYHVVVPKFGVLQPSRTSLEYRFKGTSTSNVIDADYKVITNEVEYEFLDFERHAMSRSNEINDLSSNKSSIFDITLNTTSDLVSPVINLSRKSTLFVENIINNDYTNEHTRYGNAVTKYVSKKVVLADGQEAEDLKVFLTAHRPPETDIKVFVKLWNNEDAETFDEKVWTELEYTNGGDLIYTSPTNVRDYREYEFNVPSINAVAYAAFANNATSTEDPLSGTINISNNSNIITGTGTAFNTEISVGDRIRVVSNDYFAIRTVVNIANSTQLTVDNGLQASNTASLYYVFNDGGNDGIVEYRNTSNSRFIGYKEFAIKIVLLSSNPVKVPRLNDVRAIALQI